MSSVMNMELPLDGEVWGLLQDEAARSGQPTVSLVSHVLAQWAHERHRQRVAEEIAEFAAAHAGSSLDLDHDLETAALETLGEQCFASPAIADDDLIVRTHKSLIRIANGTAKAE